MGMTGSGKSHFIDLCTGNAADAVGHGLESYTRAITVHTLQRRNRTVHLLDTPGFNDTRRSDADILTELAFWLGRAAATQVQIAGVIYIHSITATRLQGSAVRGLDVFRQICGLEAYPGVVMLTTHWDAVTHDPHARHRALERQRELEQDAWRDVVAGGGTALGLWPATREGALAVVDRVVGWGRTVTLKLQREVRDEGVELRNTGAGRLLFERYEEVVRVLEQEMEKVKREIAEALREQAERNAANLRLELEEMRRDVRRQTEAVRDLAVSMRDVSVKEMKKAEENAAQLRMMMLETQAKVKALENAPPQVKVVQVPIVQKQQRDIRRVQEISLSSQACTAQTVSAVAGVASVALAAATLCTIM